MGRGWEEGGFGGGGGVVRAGRRGKKGEARVWIRIWG